MKTRTPRSVAAALTVALSGAAAVAQDRPGMTASAIDKGYLLAGADDGRIVQVDAETTLKVTPRHQVPGTPVARVVNKDPRATDPLDSLQTPTRTLSSSQCLVDFSDYDALDRLTYAPPPELPYAESTVTYSPWWFQSCNGLDHAVVRPISPYGHFHLGYEDPAITTCHPGTLVDWGILQDDGTCDEFDPREKARYVSPHDEFASIHLYVYDGNVKALFGLDAVRVRSQQPMRLCYKPLQEDNGEWETNEPGGATSPGIWLCWDELGTGNWDLSAFTAYITEVKISSTSHAGIVTFDDVVLRVYH